MPSQITLTILLFMEKSKSQAPDDKQIPMIQIQNSKLFAI